MAIGSGGGGQWSGGQSAGQWSGNAGQWSGPWYEEPDTILSKKMSQVLRHTAAGLGLEVLEGGFVRVRDLLEVQGGRHFAGYTEADIVRVVRNNVKQRFSLGEDERSDLTVRANQGHTGSTGAAINDESLLTEVNSQEELERKGETCVHGTYWSCWESIKAEGLKPMGRNHVHFAIRVPNTGEVVSGMRASCELFIFLDVPKALKAGMKLYRSSNAVLLSRGLNGVIAPEFFQRVVDRWQNKQIFPPAPVPGLKPLQPLGERRVPGLRPAPPKGKHVEERGAARKPDPPKPPSPKVEEPDDWEALASDEEAARCSGPAAAASSSAPQRAAGAPRSRASAADEVDRNARTTEVAERQPPRLAPRSLREGEVAHARRWTSTRTASETGGSNAPQLAKPKSSAQDSTVGSSQEPDHTDLDKELRKLEKQLRQIEAAEQKRSEGKALKQEEQDKVNRKGEIERRIAELRGLGLAGG